MIRVGKRNRWVAEPHWKRTVGVAFGARREDSENGTFTVFDGKRKPRCLEHKAFTVHHREVRFTAVLGT
jgi:hypothetical protein